MYATTTTGHHPHITVSKDSRVVLQMSINNNTGVIRQDTTRTEEKWVGLSYTDALSVCTASETSTLDNTTRQYLGGAKLTFTGVGTYWNTVENCWGTRVTSQLQKMGETNLYQVSKITEEMTVEKVGGGTLTLI